jgi:hypothetical protein
MLWRGGILLGSASLLYGLNATDRILFFLLFLLLALVCVSLLAPVALLVQSGCRNERGLLVGSQCVPFGCDKFEHFAAAQDCARLLELRSAPGSVQRKGTYRMLRRARISVLLRFPLFSDGLSVKILVLQT